MGGLPSKVDEDIQTVEQVPQENISTFTPRVKTLKELDPRSPSTNVIRTPVGVLDVEIVPDKDLNGILPITPVLSRKVRELRELDPRSPSKNVPRTPIENLFLIKKEDNGELPFNEKNSTPRNICLNIDPRSPADDFIRTPIIVATRICDFDEPPMKSSQILSEKLFFMEDAEKRKSYVLLETNLDYEETDIDVAYQKISPIRQKMNKIVEERNESTVISTETVKVDLLQEDNTNLNASEDIINEIEVPDGIKSQEKEEKKFLKNTSEVQILTKNNLGQEEETSLETQSPIKQNTSKSVSMVENVSETTIKMRETSKNGTKDLNVLENVKDFDKKLTNLIYKDEELEVVKKNKAKTNVRNRTPLTTRNEITNPKRRTPKLKVTDKPRKIDKEFSKIPTSKLQKKSKIAVQCENTPPRQMLERSARVRKQEWDADKTMII